MSKFDPNKVNLNNCFCNGNRMLNDRYSLTLELNSTNSNHKTAIIIMKNPASTARANIFYNIPFINLNDVDITTINVLNKLPAGRYNKIVVLNLFPYYDSNPKTLNFIYPLSSISTNNSYKNNINEIKKILSTPTDVICAWGTNTTMSKKILDKAITDILPLLNNHNVLEYQNGNLLPVTNITKPFYPLHGKMW